MKNKTFIYLFLIFSMAIVHLMIFTKTAELGYINDEQKNALDLIRSDNRTLSAKLSKKEALDRIEKIARNELKMVVPQKIKYLFVTEEAR